MRPFLGVSFAGFNFSGSFVEAVDGKIREECLNADPFLPIG